MAFKEWWAKKIEDGYGEVEILLREAWEAATAEEREACADIADDAEPHGWTGAIIADAIRMRSNSNSKT